MSTFYHSYKYIIHINYIKLITTSLLPFILLYFYILLFPLFHVSMAEDHELLYPNRRVASRGIPLRRRKLPMVRLGGKRPRRVVVLIGMLRRIRLKRWLKLHYLSMLRKLKENYRNLVKDLGEARASLETFQQRVFIESSFALPVMGVSFNGYPSHRAGSDHRPRTLVM